MCGIFLVVDRVIDTQTILSIFKKLVNRGPDFDHYWIKTISDKNPFKRSQIFMGQTVLSITGQDYMTNFVSKSGRFQILFIGEIYNLKDLDNQYQNDTKFLVNYMEKYLTLNLKENSNSHDYLDRINEANQSLDGMYAYILYDREKNLLYLSRDIQGEKNLYYYYPNHDSNSYNSYPLVISSEISLILDYLRDNDLEIKLEENQLKKYFYSRHHIYRKKTIYQDIYQLEPGETKIYNLEKLVFEIGNIQGLDTLIEPELYMRNSLIPFKEHLEYYDKLFRELAKDMVPEDYDYACVVSGGIDSSLSAYYFMQTKKKPKYLFATNCLGKDWISNNLELHEEVLKHKVTIIPITADDYAKEIVYCQRAYGGPVSTHSAITFSILTRKVKEMGIKVLMTGEGADELFGGYSTYFGNHLNNQEKELEKIFQELDYNYSNYSRFIDFDLDHDHDDSFKEEFKRELSEFWNLSKDKYNFIDSDEKYYQASLLCDSLVQLPNVGLKSADLMGMNNGVETRTIFLRKPVMKMILNSPLSLKLDFRTEFTKILLKELYLKYFPYRSLFPKQGFAGFPNESKIYLESLKKEFLKEGQRQDLNTKNHLKINTNSEIIPRDLEWKIINVDYFLHHFYQDYLVDPETNDKETNSKDF